MSCIARCCWTYLFVACINDPLAVAVRLAEQLKVAHATRLESLPPPTSPHQGASLSRAQQVPSADSDGCSLSAASSKAR
ncbi:hypothetical protein PF006_g18990 [Phytophthora fragariae]|uniref:Uncharacterized protein n=1 Tax=Phytophthora fragariae TaxID=53985 RepID=A0A6A3SGP5_9STRA|nr:hypothetical protein PF006_g18990 [Phytophthora fragariae]